MDEYICLNLYYIEQLYIYIYVLKSIMPKKKSTLVLTAVSQVPLNMWM